MNNFLRIKLTDLPYLIIILVAMVTFWDIRNIFFQQDEWIALGRVLAFQGDGGIIGYLQNVLSGNTLIRFLPFTSLTVYSLFSLFGLNPELHGLFALSVATVNALLMYIVINKFSKSIIIALITSVFWLTNGLSSQAITWIGTIIPSQLSMTAFLISLYFFLVYLDSSLTKLRWLLLSLIFMAISLSYKESGIYYIVTYSLLLWFDKDKFTNQFRAKFKTTLLIAIPIFLILITPRLVLFVNNQTNFSPAPVGQPTADNIAYNAFLLPARSIFQIFLPVKTIYENIYAAGRTHYYVDAGLGGCAVECLVGDAFSTMVSFYILLVMLLAFSFMSGKHKKIILISFASFVASLLPFVGFPNREAVLEPRYYIFPALWMGAMISSVCYFAFGKIPLLRAPIMLLIFVPIIFFNASSIRNSLASDIQVGEYRRKMIQTIAEIKPDLHKNNVFYFFTDHTGFYEFQSGFGQTLAVALNDTGKIPKNALYDYDFYNSYYEGLKNYPEGKFGYFMNYEKLRNAFEENPDLDVSVLHAYYWEHNEHTIRNVSDEIRSKLNKDLKR